MRTMKLTAADRRRSLAYDAEERRLTIGDNRMVFFDPHPARVWQLFSERARALRRRGETFTVEQKDTAPHAE